MNVFVIKDGDYEIQQYVDNVENLGHEYNKNKINFYYEKVSRLKIDIFLIISNDIDFIEKNFNTIKTKESILIITNNFEPKHILACLLLSENLFSMRKGEEYILSKMNYIYEQNKEKELSKRSIVNAKSY